MLQQTMYASRLNQVKTFLQANCEHNASRVELNSMLAPNSELRGRKLAFNILHRQLIQSSFLYKAWDTSLVTLSASQVSANMFMNFVVQSTNSDFYFAASLPPKTDRLFDQLNLL